MADNWDPLLLHAYKIDHEMKRDTDEDMLEALIGGNIKLIPKVKQYIDRLKENSTIESNIFFTKPDQVEIKHKENAFDEFTDSSDNEDQASEMDSHEDVEEKEIIYSTKYYLEQVALREDDGYTKNIALHLLKALDKRINPGLLLILVSEDQDDILSRRIILWYLPIIAGGFSFFKNEKDKDNGYMLDLVPSLYVDTGKKFKSAMFEGNISRQITEARVSDTSMTGSRYWVEDFLGASFEIDSPQVQKKLAQSLRKIAKTAAKDDSSKPRELNQRDEDGLNMVEDEWEPAFDFDTAVKSVEELDDNEEITIDRFIEEYVPESKKQTFTRSFPEEVRSVPFEAKSTKQTFQEQFRRKKIRAILSDNSVIEIIGTREDIEKHLKRNVKDGKVTFTLEARDTIEDLMR